jgi:hypothetical protein
MGGSRRCYSRGLIPPLPHAPHPPSPPSSRSEGVSGISVIGAHADGAFELLRVLLRQGGAATGSHLANIGEGSYRGGTVPPLALHHSRLVPALHPRDPQAYPSLHAGRRLIRKVNEEQYVNLIRCYEVDVKELLEAGRVEVLEEYGLSLEDLEKMEEGYEMF